MKKLMIDEKCFVCGHDASFLIADNATLLREAKCSNCQASKRNSDLAHSIVKTFTSREGISLAESLPLLRKLRIYEASSTGCIHELLKRLPFYICSEYFDDLPRGHVKDGVRCEDLRALTFSDNSFDLVITEDVLEHVPDPESSFREIRRVLKPGRYHIFTVPFHEGKQTVTRAVMEDNKIINVKPPVYHGDPLRKSGALVYTDFGEDIITMLNSMGMHTEVITYSRWHKSEELSFIDTDDLYEIYLKHYRNNDLLSFFKYNSVVFVSQKDVLTDERYMPELEVSQTSYEHWHRYLYATGFVKGKKVLDIACGAGYGSALLAQHAQKVVGVDISVEAIKIASGRYAKDNLEFKSGPADKIPVEESAFFDVVISFETIEHLPEEKQVSFLSEIKRLIKPDGLFISSTPNKLLYSDIPNYRNEFHLKEFHIDEFKDFLGRFFKNVTILGQKVYTVSYIWNANVDTSWYAEYRIKYTNDGFRPTNEDSKSALFVIALCSDSNIDCPAASVLVDISEKLLLEHDRLIEEFRNSWSWRVTAPLRWFGRTILRMKG